MCTGSLGKPRKDLHPAKRVNLEDKEKTLQLPEESGDPQSSGEVTGLGASFSAKMPGDETQVSRAPGGCI